MELNLLCAQTPEKYILSQDSMGDILYNLKEENIIQANEPEEIDEEDWDDLSDDEIREMYQ
jgi:hypothetical protein